MLSGLEKEQDALYCQDGPCGDKIACPAMLLGSLLQQMDRHNINTNLERPFNGHSVYSILKKILSIQPPTWNVAGVELSHPCKLELRSMTIEVLTELGRLSLEDWPSGEPGQEK